MQRAQREELGGSEIHQTLQCVRAAGRGVFNQLRDEAQVEFVKKFTKSVFYRSYKGRDALEK